MKFSTFNTAIVLQSYLALNVAGLAVQGVSVTNTAIISSISRAASTLSTSTISKSFSSTSTTASTLLSTPTVIPISKTPISVKSATYLGIVTDPTLNRDSCTSVRIGGRVLWTCRDTMTWDVATQQGVIPMWQNTAAWTNWSSSTGPVMTPAASAPKGSGSIGKDDIYKMSGTPGSFFPLSADMCGTTAGVCSDGTRWVYWPDTSPLMTTPQTASTLTSTGYAILPKHHLQGWQSLTPQPSFTLFKLTSSPLLLYPSVTVVKDSFHALGTIGFGDYGSLIANGTAYFYGLTSTSQTVLAKAPITSIENKATWTYYHVASSTWRTTPPSLSGTDNLEYVIPNAGFGQQGTFYYSAYHGRYIYLGAQRLNFGANFFMASASRPEGPWSAPTLVYSGPNGNGIVGAYSLQAHPGLSADTLAGRKSIHLSWTMPMSKTGAGGSVYGDDFVQPLVRLDWA